MTGADITPPPRHTVRLAAPEGAADRAGAAPDRASGGVSGRAFGPGHFTVIAGPCSVESEQQLSRIAEAVSAAGCGALRGGAFKPRTHPGSFQGLGAEGLRLLAKASRECGLPVVTEVLDPRDVELVAGTAAMLQIGSRNMQNAPLLREAGRTGLPVLLKRGAAATLEELIAAADYVLQEGNPNVVLCERGVRSFDPATRYLLDLAAVPALRQRTGLPVVVDPSHGTGRAALVAPMACAALAAGADGIMVEVHHDPANALSDGAQALVPAEFAALMQRLEAMIPVMRQAEQQPPSGNGVSSAAAACAPTGVST